MITKVFDVFGLGQCSLDYLGVIPGYPPADSKCEFRELAVQGGGPVATALAALSRWGLSCYFAGVIGDDSFGTKILASIAGEGIDTRGVAIRKGCLSQLAFIAVEPSVGRRTIFWQRPTGTALDINEVDCILLQSSRIFHTDGLFIEASLNSARVARKAGLPVSIDAGTLRPGMLDLARESTFYVASESFAQSFMGENDPINACRRLGAMGPEVAVVTLGARGYVALHNGRVIERPACRADTVDTTGCGDVFHAGFLYGFLKGWTVERSLEFSAWAASRVSRCLGGRQGIPGMDEVRRYEKRRHRQE